MLCRPQQTLPITSCPKQEGTSLAEEYSPCFGLSAVITKKSEGKHLVALTHAIASEGSGDPM